MNTPLAFDHVYAGLAVTTRKQLHDKLAALAAPGTGLSRRVLTARLEEQERQIPAGIGGGVAIAHLHLDGLQKALSAFIQLKAPIAMTTPDARKVDLFCLLLTPERDGTSYLRTMSRLSRLLKDERLCLMLRNAQNEKDIRVLFEQSSVQSGLMAA